MMCVDASLAIKWVFFEEHSDRALALAERAAEHDEELIAPALLGYELTNTVRRRAAQQGLPVEEALLLLRDALSYPITVRNPERLHERALAIAHTYHLHATYDAHYIAVAEDASCDLWTDDRRLLRALNGRLPFVRSIADYPTA